MEDRQVGKLIEIVQTHSVKDLTDCYCKTLTVDVGPITTRNTVSHRNTEITQ